MSSSKRQKVAVEGIPQERLQSAVPPVVAYFASGNPADDLTQDECAFELFEKREKKTNHYGVVGTSGTVDYVGRTSGGENSGLPPCSYAVGIFNKETGKLQVLPVAGGRICRLEARVHGLQYEATGGGAVGDASTAEMSLAERMAHNKRLVESFGSTRRRRQLNQREDAVVKAERLASATLVNHIVSATKQQAEAGGISRDKILKAATQHRNLPPHHPEATTWDKAYLLHELIPPAVQQSLGQGKLLGAAESTEQAKKLQDRRQVPGFILSRLCILEEKEEGGGASREAKRRAKCLAFLAALLQMNGAGKVIYVDFEKGGLDDVSKRLKMRREMLEALLELFAARSPNDNGEQWERPADKRELLLSYILATTLLAESGFVHGEVFEGLRNELNLTPQDLAMRFRELGATTSPTIVSTPVGDPALAREAMPGATPPGKTKTYQVMLLKAQGDEPKTLEQCFPAIKMGAKKNR